MNGKIINSNKNFKRSCQETNLFRGIDKSFICSPDINPLCFRHMIMINRFTEDYLQRNIKIKSIKYKTNKKCRLHYNDLPMFSLFPSKCCNYEFQWNIKIKSNKQKQAKKCRLHHTYIAMFSLFLSKCCN